MIAASQVFFASAVFLLHSLSFAHGRCPEALLADITPHQLATAYLQTNSFEQVTNSETGEQQTVSFSGPSNLEYGELQLIQLRVDGFYAGDISFIAQNSNRVFIRGLYVGDPYQRQGISTYLFAKLLALMPDLNEIETDIDGVNLEIYQQSLNNNNAPKEAIKQTPAYKIRERFGFSQVVEVGRRNSVYLSFTVRRNGYKPYSPTNLFRRGSKFINSVIKKTE